MAIQKSDGNRAATLVAAQYARYVISYDQRSAPDLSEEIAEAMDDSGMQIFRSLAKLESASVADVNLKMRALATEYSNGDFGPDAELMLDSIARDLERLSN
jgi:hypothetical protein